MYKLVMRGEGGQKEEFRKRMEVGQVFLLTVQLNGVVLELRKLVLLVQLHQSYFISDYHCSPNF